MCETNAYLRRSETEELVLEEVAFVEPTDRGYRLRSLLGEETEIRARLEEINLIKHRIVFAED